MLLAAHIAALLDATLALERERRTATHDSLTDLLNRRGFDERFEEKLVHARQEGSTLSLLLLDCDNLKELNERGGHALGDRALQTIADCLRAHSGPVDTPGRLGGDEFALLLPNLDSPACAKVAERIRAANSYVRGISRIAQGVIAGASC
jgi:diguanylate cyclase (GGDEF)-like protein